MNTERHSGIELLRIISMFFVLNLHFIIKGLYSESSNSIVKYESYIIVCFSVVAVNCYVLISGFFLSNRSFKLSRVTLLYSQVWFYSVVTFIIMIAFRALSFSYGIMLQSVFPFIFKNYWFVKEYILLLIFTPLLNSAINKLDKNKFKLVLGLLLSVYCVLNYLSKPLNPIDSSSGYGVIWFIVLYLSSAYLQRFYTIENKPLKYLIIYICSVCLNSIMSLFLWGKGEVWGNAMIRDYNNVLVYIGAVSLFLFFLNVQVKKPIIKKIVFFISPLTFAVYLIHESPFVSEWLWGVINANTWCTNNWLFIIQAFGTVFGIFCFCCAIEFIRSRLFVLFRINYIIVKVSNFIELKLRDLVLRIHLF